MIVNFLAENPEKLSKRDVLRGVIFRRFRVLGLSILSETRGVRQMVLKTFGDKVKALHICNNILQAVFKLPLGSPRNGPTNP